MAITVATYFRSTAKSGLSSCRGASVLRGAVGRLLRPRLSSAAIDGLHRAAKVILNRGEVAAVAAEEVRGVRIHRVVVIAPVDLGHISLEVPDGDRERAQSSHTACEVHQADLPA